MSETDSSHMQALRREYEAGRISADTYINAGGDPDVVQTVGESAANSPANRMLRLIASLAAFLLILVGVGMLISGNIIPGLFALPIGITAAMLSPRIGRR